MASELRGAVEAIGRILGRIDNEDMLDEHEDEVKRLKNYLEANSGIFAKVRW